MIIGYVAIISFDRLSLLLMMKETRGGHINLAFNVTERAPENNDG